MRIDLQDLCASYGNELVLDAISCRFPAGKIITILGPNGSGKSTLLKVIGRILKARSGTLLLDGKSIHHFGTAELARRMAVLPQIHESGGEMTVRELISMGRYPHRKGVTGVMTPEDREAVKHAIDLTGLAKLCDRPMNALSGGERQRAWIAMTLAQEPELLLLDEPTTYLDVRCQFEIIEMVRDLNRKLGITVLMVLHDLNLAARCSDLLVTIKDCRITHVGTPGEIIKKEVLREVFGIHAEIATDQSGYFYCVPTGCVRKGDA